MKFTLVSLLALGSAPVIRGLTLQKRASNSWGGGNLYFLHGLSDSDQEYYINTLASDKAKAVRLWVTELNAGCQKGSKVVSSIPDLEPDSIGTYNDTVLDALDGVLAKLVTKGIKAIISPHDGNAFGLNSCDVYGKAYGCSKSDSAGDSFYSSTTAKSQYDARMAHVLNYKSRSSGKAWSQWGEAILAFDIQNEPFQQAEDQASNNDPNDWLCGRAGNMNALINNSGVKLATGGVGGDQSHGNNLMPKAIECSAIDLISIHGYVGTANFWSSNLPSMESTAASNNKLLYVEEWGVTTSDTDNFDSQASAINGAGIPFVYWEFTPGPDGTQNCWTGCCTGYDGYEVGLNSTKGNVQQALQSAASRSAAQDWSGLID
ncbi:glycoside hydrolase family 5 protein [Viridothelium virens]|uniref:mannan endo-1,4-beta-mannosidase n=1 Tax=Viridothelium virens TaxID=1048519 RepID=A0A6A6HDE2_VIRVR|nr:glycoside hydrolase family 5 protein [Viridothelium virens]